MEKKEDDFYGTPKKYIATQTSMLSNHEQFLEKILTTYEYDMCVEDLVELNFGSKSAVLQLIRENNNFIPFRRKGMHVTFKTEDVVDYLRECRGKKYENK